MISRRNFISISGLAGGGMLVSLNFSPSVNAKKSMAAKIVESSKLNHFLSIDNQGAVTILLTKHEMGQGTGTAAPMIVADELGADWEKVIIRRADYNPKFTRHEMGTTGGSSAIWVGWDSFRQAGATARELLKQAAAKQWNVSATNLQVAKGQVINPATGAKLSFGTLAAVASKMPVPENVELKSLNAFTYIGKPFKNRITREVIRGKGDYGMDMYLPQMVFASIEKCPVYQGSLISYDDTEARKIPGVIDIFPLKPGKPERNGQHVQEGIVVVATSTWTTFKARKLLKPEWDQSVGADRNMQYFIANLKNNVDKGNKLYEIGNVEAAMNLPGSEVLEMDYYNPYQAHALMEPINATAHVTDERIEVWVAAQDGGIVNEEVSYITNVPGEKITVHILNSGGSFGRRYHVDSSLEAVMVSQKIKKPVKVVWSREDEVMHDYFHPPQFNRIRGVISMEKEVIALENYAAGTSNENNGGAIWEQKYYFPNIRSYSFREPSLVHEGAWRSVGEHRAALSVECMIDEFADKLGKDPLDYRLELFQNEIEIENSDGFPGWVIEEILPGKATLKQSHLDIINYIKSHGLWDIDLSPGQGKGFAITSFGLTVCGQIAIVNMDDPDYGFKVEKIIAVVDCGLVVNPHFGEGQIQGAIIWALSALKYGGLEVENGVVRRQNFHNNRVMRMDEIPEIEVIFLKGREKMSGLGEPGTPPLAPAVLNAIFNASGKRIRTMPVTKELLAETMA